MSISWYFVVISILFAGWVKESRGSCDLGFWGEDCGRKCAEGCSFDLGCDKDNGVCVQCINGFYGPHCGAKCSENCVECDQETGLCTSCEYSWYGNLCTKRCNSTNCYRCSISDGQCYSCKRGYWGTNCENECGSGEECLFKCDTGSNSSVCQYACKCNTCYKTSGICIFCAAGFWGKGCYRRCPQNCTRCSYSDGRCNECYNGYFGSECQYECPQTCTTCSIHGLCSTCKKGYWGQSCEHECSHCASCNFYYGYCTECKHGYWGNSCNYKCPDGCTCCNIGNGACNENGCVPSDSSKPQVTGSTETEQLSTITITGIAMIIVGIILCAVCATLGLVIIRRMKINQQDDGKNVYESPQPQTGCQNDLELYEVPSY